MRFGTRDYTGQQGLHLGEAREATRQRHAKEDARARGEERKVTYTFQSLVVKQTRSPAMNSLTGDETITCTHGKDKQDIEEN